MPRSCEREISRREPNLFDSILLLTPLRCQGYDDIRYAGSLLGEIFVKNREAGSNSRWQDHSSDMCK